MPDKTKSTARGGTPKGEAVKFIDQISLPNSAD